MFDIDKAIEYGNTHLLSKTSGQCAKHVRLMLEAGGLDTTGRPVAACNYDTFLPKIGFTQIATLNNRLSQTEFSKKSVIIGDIAVMDHAKYGHICIWNGKNWISDFRQNNMWPYSGNGICKIFRYNK